MSFSCMLTHHRAIFSLFIDCLSWKSESIDVIRPSVFVRPFVSTLSFWTGCYLNLSFLYTCMWHSRLRSRIRVIVEHWLAAMTVCFYCHIISCTLAWRGVWRGAADTSNGEEVQHEYCGNAVKPRFHGSNFLVASSYVNVNVNREFL